MIHMLNNNNDITILKDIKTIDYNQFLNLSPLIPFSKDIVHYIDALSKELKKDKRLINNPDVAAFSFFCREKNILNLKK